MSTANNRLAKSPSLLIDMLDGVADGTPPLESHEQYKQWMEMFSKEFLRLRSLSSAGKHTFLDSYGAVNEAEFFAVVTEQFFDQPIPMKKYHPELYGALRKFYRQDPSNLPEGIGRGIVPLQVGTSSYL